MIKEFIEAFNNYKGLNKTKDSIEFKPHLTLWRENNNQVQVYELRVKQMGIVSVVISVGNDNVDKAPVPVGVLSKEEQRTIINNLKSSI